VCVVVCVQPHLLATLYLSLSLSLSQTHPDMHAHSDTHKHRHFAATVSQCDANHQVVTGGKLAEARRMMRKNQRDPEILTSSGHNVLS